MRSDGDRAARQRRMKIHKNKLLVKEIDRVAKQISLNIAITNYESLGLLFNAHRARWERELNIPEGLLESLYR